MTGSHGFLFSLEAALCALLLLIAASSLPLFSKKTPTDGGLLTCHDAAGILVKSGAFESQESLEASLNSASRLSCMCISASCGSLYSSAGDCDAGEQDGQRASFSFPAWSGGQVRAARVSCS